jgi:hypothetical protein
VTTTLIEHWNGHFWTLVEGPRFGPLGGDELEGVSALSDSDAWAVGNYYTGSEFDTLVEHWDGTSWSQVPSPSPGGAGGSYLNGVSALATNDVWAVGETHDGTLIEHWDGNSWSVVPSPGRAGTRLAGVSALSATNAYAAGDTSGAHSRAYIVHWDGVRWKHVPLGTPGKVGRLDEIDAVSASSASDVWAVGMRTGSRQAGMQGLIEHFDGNSWSEVAGLNPGGRHGTRLEGVSALSADDVWAVGTYATAARGPDSQRPFIEHWDGTSWKLMRTGRPAGHRKSAVVAVDAMSPTQAFAAGTWVFRGGFQTMTLNWDGQRWVQL